MAKLRQQIVFPNSGLNSDDETRWMQVGDSPYRLNCMVGEEGSNGVITNLKGCEKVEYNTSIISFSNSDIYTVVGSYYDAATRACYYFIHSLPYDATGSDDYLYDDKLLRYNTDTETIDLIFLDTGNYLGLTSETMMKDITMIDGWLFFNPKGTGPKMIDVDMAYNYTRYDTYDPAEAYVLGDVVNYYGGIYVATAAAAATESPAEEPTKWDEIGEAYSNLTYFDQREFEFCFDVIKQPPSRRLRDVSYATDTTYGANNVRGKVFTFAYRYQYWDGAYSVYSAYSTPALPTGGEMYSGEIIGDITNNNYINITVPLGIPSLIKTVEVVFREGEGDWYLLTTIDRQATSLRDYDGAYPISFYNNASYKNVDNFLLDEIYHAVPREAGCQAMIGLNTLLYGRCKEGFDSLSADDIDVTLTAGEEQLTPALDIQTLKRDLGFAAAGNPTGDWKKVKWEGRWLSQSGSVEHPYFYAPDRYYTVLKLDWFPGIGAAEVVEGDVISITLGWTRYLYTLTAADVVSVDTFGAALVAFLSDKSSMSVYYSDDGLARFHPNFGSGDFELHTAQCLVFESEAGYMWISPTTQIYTAATTVSSLAKRSGFKTGANHPFCLFYYDENLRRSGANISGDTTCYVPTIPEAPLTGINYKFNIEWEVNHTPPSWAKYWRWGYAGNSLTSSFRQYIIAGMAIGTDPDDDKWLIDITPLQTLKTSATSGYNVFPNSIIDEYVWEAGDRIRFITEKTAPASVASPYIGAVADAVYEYEILGYDDDTKKISIRHVSELDTHFGENSLVEIYTPKRSVPAAEAGEATTLEGYFEFGDLMPIKTDAVTGALIHGAWIETNDQDDDAGTPATGVFTTGDVYHIVRTPSKPLSTSATTAGVFHESMHYSDFYISDYWDRGKIGFIDRIGEKTLNIIRYSNTYIQGTEINGLTAFEPLNFKELNDVYGDIRAMREVGDTLKVYQDVKASSIQIGRREYVDAMGNKQVVTSDQVLGSIRYSNTSYGTVFAESVTKNNRHIYGFDIYNGVLWRDSANGIFPVSGRFQSADGAGDYKMESAFKSKSKSLLASGVANVRVYTLWDEEHGALYVTFIDKADNTNSETLLFHEGSNRWISYADISRQDTWNEFLFPEYFVVKGFEGGLEIDYDSDDGYTYFDLDTSASNAPEPSVTDIEIESLGVDVVVSVTPLPSLTDIEIESLEVDVVIKEISVSPSSKTWESFMFGSSEAEDITLSASAGESFIQSKPVWLSVEMADSSNSYGGNLIAEGDPIPDGRLLRMYPASANTGSLRTGTLTFMDDAFNEASITVTQLSGE